MYSLNGIPLDNDAFGWLMLDTSEPIMGHSASRERLQIPGRDGIAAGLISTADSTVLAFTVETPRAGYARLVALAASDPVITPTAAPGPDESAKFVSAEYLSATPEGYGPADEILEVRLLFSIPGAFWRSVTEVTQGPFSIVSASQEVSILTSITAPVQDAIVRVKGAVTGLRITDGGSGAFFTYSGALTTAEYLRFESATGRAYVTTSDVWVGGTEVSGAISFDGPRDLFEITPVLAVDGASSGADLVMTTTTRTSASLSVRARGAYREL